MQQKSSRLLKFKGSVFCSNKFKLWHKVRNGQRLIPQDQLESCMDTYMYMLWKALTFFDLFINYLGVSNKISCTHYVHKICYIHMIYDTGWIMLSMKIIFSLNNWIHPARAGAQLILPAGNGVDVILQILSTSSIFVAKTCHQISSHRWG